MLDPKKFPREPEDDLYTCPDQSRGHFYTGVTNVSLVDIKRQKIINTLEITSDGIGSGSNTLDLPYLIKKGYYDVPRINKNKEGKPILMNLKDYNADGKPFEFALFDAIACMGLETTLIGYSEKQDKVIQYQTELKMAGETSKEYWVDYLFGHKADKRGVWKYEIDYRGRAGALEKYEIRYDKKREMFYGTRTSIFEEKDRPNK
ncbi:MAG: hypothetical protein ABJA66_21085 [Actinomycetota bacterium]